MKVRLLTNIISKRPQRGQQYAFTLPRESHTSSPSHPLPQLSVLSELLEAHVPKDVNILRPNHVLAISLQVRLPEWSPMHQRQHYRTLEQWRGQGCQMGLIDESVWLCRDHRRRRPRRA